MNTVDISQKMIDTLSLFLSDLGCIMITPDGAIISHNNCACKLLRCPNMVGMNINNYIEEFEPALELTLVEKLDLYYYVYEGVERKKNIYTVILFDKTVADKKIINDVIRELQYMNAIFDFNNDGIFVTDANGIVIKVNKSSEKFCCTTAGKLVGRNVRELVAEGIFDNSMLSKVLETKEALTMMQNTKSGCRVIVTGTPVFDANGDVQIIIFNSRDITKLVELKDQLEASEDLIKHYKEQLSEKKNIERVLNQKGVMKEKASFIAKVAKVDATILLEGESGVGKNVTAQEIVRQSPRANGPFIEINCGAIPPTLLESELFGYAKGAFTGASKEGKPGLIELANTGTLFLDEIGDMPMDLQVKLLRVLQDNQLYRLGSTKLIQVNVRVIVATNKNLKMLVEEGLFREDLYYRINVLPIYIPPLRERVDEIPDLLSLYLEKFNVKYKVNMKLHPKTIQWLLNYQWPGNIRELVNVLERLVLTSEKEMIMPDLLPKEITSKSNDKKRLIPLKEAVHNAERELLEYALQTTTNTYELGKMLGVSQPTIVRKLRQYHLRTNSAK